MMTLIVPIAADKADYVSKLPQPFRIDDEGTMYCVKAITGLPLNDFQDIYFVILRAHDSRFMLSEQLAMQFRKLKLANAHVTILDEPTTSQAETVSRAIELNSIKGTIFIKDADCYLLPMKSCLKTGWPSMLWKTYRLLTHNTKVTCRSMTCSM